MDPRTLGQFLTLADTLHFGRASEACHVSPSTLSRVIAQLEDRLGVVLFERDNRSVLLTLEGELFQRYAREALQHWESFQNSLLEGTRELHGEISLYCSVTASYSFLFDVLTRFRRRHPQIRIKLHTGDPELATSRVLAGEEQLSIGARPERLPAGLAFQPVALSPLVFIAPRAASGVDAVLQRKALRAADWRRLPMIVPERGVVRSRVDAWFSRKKVSPDYTAQVAGNEAIVSMVSLGGGVGVVPGIVLDNSPLADTVRTLPVKPALAPLELGLFVLKKRLQNRLLRAFWATVPRD
ncbi:MAG: HTH-type transcriptional activator IlvY [Pseudomonadota bacterium]